MMNISITAAALRGLSVTWPEKEKANLEKRISKRENVDLLDVYKLFTPWSMQALLLRNGHRAIAQRWALMLRREPSFDDGTHEKYIAWNDKCLKDALRAE
jgi:hypothetical protein